MNTKKTRNEIIWTNGSAFSINGVTSEESTYDFSNNGPATDLYFVKQMIN